GRGIAQRIPDRNAVLKLGIVDDAEHALYPFQVTSRSPEHAGLVNAIGNYDPIWLFTVVRSVIKDVCTCLVDVPDMALRHFPDVRSLVYRINGTHYITWLIFEGKDGAVCSYGTTKKAN